MPTVDSGGVTISYVAEGTGPPVVLVHGFASSVQGNWRAPGIIDALVAAGRRVVALDCRGHGASGGPGPRARSAKGERAIASRRMRPTARRNDAIWRRGGRGASGEPGPRREAPRGSEQSRVAAVGRRRDATTRAVGSEAERGGRAIASQGPKGASPSDGGRPLVRRSHDARGRRGRRPPQLTRMAVDLRRPDPARLDEEATAAMAVQVATLRATLPGIAHPHTPDEDRLWMRGNCERLSVWVAVDEGRIVGVASRDGEWVRQLFVAAERTGQGIGQRLLDRMLDEARKDDMPRLSLWTFQRNAGACRFYERNGFVAVECTDGSGNEEREPDVRYERPLR